MNITGFEEKEKQALMDLLVQFIGALLYCFIGRPKGKLTPRLAA